MCTHPGTYRDNALESPGTWRAHGQIRHEMPIHHIQMQKVRPMIDDGPAFIRNRSKSAESIEGATIGSWASGKTVLELIR